MVPFYSLLDQLRYIIVGRSFKLRFGILAAYSKKMKNVGLLIVSVLLVSCGADKFLSGTKNFERHEYDQAAQNLREAYPKLKNREEKTKAAYVLGKSYFEQGKYALATPWLKNAVRFNSQEPDLDLDLADALRSSGKIEDSKTIYNEVLSQSPKNQRAINALKGIALYDSSTEYPRFYVIEKLSSLNSRGNETPAYFDYESGHFYFSSSREQAEGKVISPKDGYKLSDIYYAEFDSTVQKWNIAENKISNLITVDEESNMTISPDGKSMIIERASYRPEKPMVSQLYFSTKEGNGWSLPELLAFSADGAQYRQAFWSEEGDELIFSSDRDGGIGGFDLWQVKWNENGSSDTPMNLGDEINTLGDELYPFLKSNETLYFSSDYHPGFGGFDLFKARKNIKGLWEVENMGMPINSLMDDLGILFQVKNKNGIFASSREGSTGLDLYRFEIITHLFMCFGKVFDEETDSVIQNVNVRIVGTDGLTERLVTKNGEFQVELNPGEEYILIAYKEGFLNAQTKVSTKGLNQATEFHLDFHQTPTDNPIIIDNILYETGKWSLLPVSETSLDNLVEILTINPTIRIEIQAHTDEVGGDSFNMDLSQKRADEVVRYLVEKGVDAKRLIAKGYGENKPYRVSNKVSRRYPFLTVEDQLSESFLSTLEPSQLEIAKSLNRRTEFQVIKE